MAAHLRRSARPLNSTAQFPLHASVRPIMNKSDLIREPGDPEFVENIEINDSHNRYALTRPTTQDYITEITGAKIVTRGTWVPDVKTSRDIPLYLHITADTRDRLSRGISQVQQLLTMDHESLMNFQSKMSARILVHESIPIELPDLANFNVKTAVAGPQGAFLRFIYQESGARAEVKGHGSGVAGSSGKEPNITLHLSIIGPDQDTVDKGTRYARDLVRVLNEKHKEASDALAKAQQPSASTEHETSQQDLDQWNQWWNSLDDAGKAYYSQYYASQS